MTDEHDVYKARGVSASKEEVLEAIVRLDKGLVPGAFARISADLPSEDGPAGLVIHTDDVGTKTNVAYMAWRDGLGNGVWRGIAQDSLAMNIDDCACSGALGPFLVTNTIARNAKLIPGSVVSEIIAGYEDVCQRLERNGVVCRLVGGETSDCGDVVRTVFVESTVVTRVALADVIDPRTVRPGDVIVGFSSTGQASWEPSPNSGMGSNGLTNARHDMLSKEYLTQYPETVAPEVDRNLVYCGAFRLGDVLPTDDRFLVASALLSPTRTYAPLIKRIHEALGSVGIHAMIHCTGGGQTKIRNFGGGGLRFVKDALLPVPPLFRALKEHGRLTWKEMYRVYNMGQLLEAVVPHQSAKTCLQLARECGIDAAVTGRVEKADGPQNEVVIRAEGGEHVYG